MPRPVEAGRSYIPGLDGLRAVAVMMVIAYHLNIPGASGGNLGVGVFFTLSGYLITDLLLAHWRRHGNLGLGTFWLRRARRLLPALFLMLALVSVWVAVFDAGQLASVRRQVVSSALYVAARTSRGSPRRSRSTTSGRSRSRSSSTSCGRG